MSIKAKARGRQQRDLGKKQRERTKRIAENRRRLRISNPADSSTQGRPDPSMSGYEFVGVPSYFIRRPIT